MSGVIAGFSVIFVIIAIGFTLGCLGTLGHAGVSRLDTLLAPFKNPIVLAAAAIPAIGVTAALLA